VTWCFPFSIAKISPHLILPSLFRARDPPTVTRRSRRESHWVGDFFAAVVRTSAIAHRARKTLYCQTECTRRVGRGGSPVSTHGNPPPYPVSTHGNPPPYSVRSRRHACMHIHVQWRYAQACVHAWHATVATRAQRGSVHVASMRRRSILVSRPVATSKSSRCACLAPTSPVVPIGAKGLHY
jgi:hypothetical protein